MKRLFAATVAVLACLTLSAPAMAEDAPAYLWVNFIKAKPGKGDDLIKLTIEENAKHWDPLIESGAALDWGVAMPVVHDGKDAYSHVEWIVFNGWAGADTFMTQFMEKQRSMSAAERTAANAKWEAVVEPGSHADLVARGVHAGAGKPARPGYIHLSNHQARPGKWQEATDLYKEVVAPVYDKLVADGTIINYGMHTPEVHRGEEWSHMSWFASKDLAARDVVDKVFDAASAARSKEQREALGKRWSETLDRAGHSDQILAVVHYRYKGSE